MVFDDFLDAHLDSLRHYAAALTGNPHDAADVLSDALLKAHTRWPRIAQMEYPAAYVRRIVTTTFISGQRRWARRNIAPTISGHLPEMSSPDFTAAVDDRNELAALVSVLPPRQRAVIVMRYYLGLDNAEISRDLGITTGAARTAISRGLDHLRVAFEEARLLEKHIYDDPLWGDHSTIVAGEQGPAADDVIARHPRSGRDHETR